MPQNSQRDGGAKVNLYALLSEELQYADEENTDTVIVSAEVDRLHSASRALLVFSVLFECTDCDL